MFSLKNKMRLACALVLFCFVAMGGLAIYRLALASGQSAEMSTVWTPRTRMAQEMRALAGQYRISEAMRILSASPAMAEHANRELKDNADAFLAKLAAYRALLKKGESTGPIDEVQSLWSQYVKANELMLAFAEAGQQTQSADRFRNSASKYYLFANAMDDLSQADTKRNSAASAVANAIYVQSRFQVLLAIGVLAVLLMASIGFFEIRVWGVLTRLSFAMKRLASGDLESEIRGTERKDEVGEMARAIQVFRDNGIEMRRLGGEADEQRRLVEEARQKNSDDIQKAANQRAQVVEAIARGLEALSAGQLTYRLNDAFAPEYRKLQDDFNAAMQKLQNAMKVIAVGAREIHSSTEEISEASDKLAQRTEKQAASLEETAAALEQLTSTVRASANSANQVKLAVVATKVDAEESGAVVRRAVSAMGEIERSSHQISEIIGVMDEIAFQTNLLALNAGIEAARAGDAGRGFAVVAQEVRALAQRSTLAAKEIKTLISSSSQQVASGAGLVNDTGQALERIVAQVSEITHATSDIAAATEDQAVTLTQVNASITQMDKVTQQNAAMAEESTAASHALAQEANELARLINQFDLGAEGGAPALRAPAKQPTQRGKAVLRTMSAGNAALASHLESVIEDENWEEF
ncbi:MAG TPA: methyl-accepting chemotaxis protein [Rhizomicrobium sp.]|nr:methyl-accepting chemotaxis protein [Rhizomicrobium sp.]